MAQRSIRIKQEGDKILLISNGVLIVELPWEAADQLAMALKGAARLAEEYVMRDEVISDQALAFRCGLPFGLTNNPTMIEAAKLDALYNRDLRRYIPHASPEIKVGTPGVHNVPKYKVKNEE